VVFASIVRVGWLGRNLNHSTGDDPPARPVGWRGRLVELERLETGDPGQITGFLQAHGLGRPFRSASAEEAAVGVSLLIGAVACARLAGVPVGASSPTSVPEVVAVAYRRGGSGPPATGGGGVGEWRTAWTDTEHAAAVERVREAIGRGDVYQANVVGHRTAAVTGDPLALTAAVAALPGASYGGTLSGDGWAVGSASPEQLVRVVGERITTVPVKGTSSESGALLTSVKDQAEHVMIVDLARNDLARLARTGSVEVEQLYAVSEWSGLWHAASRVAARLEPDVGVLDVLRAVAPGGSVTGAPKHAACELLARIEPFGRGPSMGAFGFVWPGGMDLGLTIRTVAVSDGVAHLWAGGGITWGSSVVQEVAEAHAKAAPVQRALAHVRPSSS